MWFSYIMTVNLFRERSDLFMSQLRSAVLKNLTISGGNGTRIQLSWCDLTTLATISFINFICSYRLTVTRRVSRVVHKLLSLPQHLVLNGFVFLELSFSAYCFQIVVSSIALSVRFRVKAIICLLVFIFKLFLLYRKHVHLLV